MIINNIVRNTITEKLEYAGWAYPVNWSCYRHAYWLEAAPCNSQCHEINRDLKKYRLVSKAFNTEITHISQQIEQGRDEKMALWKILPVPKSPTPTPRKKRRLR